MDITISNLRKTYGTVTAVDVPHFTVEGGQLLGLVGNNGAGKTTLFRLLLDLVAADAGTVSVAGIDVSRSESWKAFTGAFLDDSFLIDYLTPSEFFRFLWRLSGASDDSLAASLTICAPLLEGVPDVLIRELSAGNRQKVGLAAAFLRSPELVVLDEPFTFLDPSSQHVLKTFLSDYIAQHPAAIILLSSHDLHHVSDVSSRIALMERGSIVRSFDASEDALSALESYFAAR